MTVVPLVPLGTANVQLNDPFPFAVNEPLVQALIVTASKTSDFRFFETENPVPDTVTVVPTGPFFGVTVIAGVVTLNFPVAT